MKSRKRIMLLVFAAVLAVGAFSVYLAIGNKTIGNERCDIHQRECLEEDIEIIVSHGGKPTAETWELLYSEEYIHSRKHLFPNANSNQPVDPKGERGKKLHRFYCPECREQERKWWHAQNQ
jgi:hypothetical protein